MKLGISSWSVPWSIGVAGYAQPPQPLDIAGLLDMAVKAQADVLQIADNLPLDHVTEKDLDRLREAARSRGLTLEAGTRGLDPQHLGHYVNIAERIGAQMLRTVLSGRFYGGGRLAQAEKEIRQVLPALEDKGVSLAFENNEAFSAADFAGLIRRIGSPLVGICLDTANSLGRPETLETVVENLAEHAVMLHAKDYDIRRIDTRMGFSVIGKAAGDGLVDFDYVLAALRRHGRDRISVIVEHWPPFERTVEATLQTEEQWLARSAQFLRSKLSCLENVTAAESNQRRDGIFGH